MARIPIYDSIATLFSDGSTAVDQALVTDDWKRSAGVRLSGGPAGDQRNVSYEFVLSGSVLTAFVFEWYQEFWGDYPYIWGAVENLPSPMLPKNTTPMPTDRVFPGAPTSCPWAREQIAIAGAAGAIDHYDITRSTTMTVPAVNSAHCKWLPMLVHGYWTRIAIRPTTTIGDPAPRLRIYAHVGGHTDVGEYTEALSVPYNYGLLPEDTA